MVSTVKVFFISFFVAPLHFARDQARSVRRKTLHPSVSLDVNGKKTLYTKLGWFLGWSADIAVVPMSVASRRQFAGFFFDFLKERQLPRAPEFLAVQIADAR